MWNLIQPKGKGVCERMLGPERKVGAGEWSKECIDDLHSDIQPSMTY
jgi:hypothetical protein